MTKTNYDISAQMRNDLMVAYRKVYRDCWTQEEAWRRTVASPAPRYYVSPKQAYQIICKMRRGEELTLRENRVRMYKSIMETLKRLARKPEHIGRTLWSIMPFVVIEPAPEFFLEPDTMKKIFSYVKRGLFDDSPNWNAANGLLIKRNSNKHKQAKKRESSRTTERVCQELA